MVLVATAASPGSAPPSAGQASGSILLDLAGHRVELTRAEAARLHATAAAQAGSSSRARDLALLLEHALVRGRVFALRRGEARTLTTIAAGVGLDDLVRRLTDRAA